MRLRCLGAWLTWMCLTIKLAVSRPLVSALASAFLSRPRRISADLTGQRALETPKALPTEVSHLRLQKIRARYALRYCNAIPKSSSFYAFSLSKKDPAYCMRASLLGGGFQGNSPWAVRPVLPA